MFFRGIESRDGASYGIGYDSRRVCFVVLTLSFVLLILSSLPLATMVKAQGPVEQSSPEESMTSSLSGLDLIKAAPAPRDPLQVLPKEMWPTLRPAIDLELHRNAHSDLDESQDLELNPLLVDGVFPYRGNPISTFLAATIAVAVQSLREQGRVDPEAIALLMNNTDFHAGWVGSATAAYTKRELGAAGAWAARKIAPKTVESIVKNQTAQFVGKIVNGLTYTIAVSGGFEYFSQFWKLATLSIPNVHTVTDLVQAPRRDQVRVLSNLLQYVANASVQKRIASSVSNHRIMTFEFLAMNIGLFVGMVAGQIIGQKIIPAAPSNFKQKLKAWFGKHMAPLIGAVFGSLVIQVIPDSFKMRVNSSLLNWKVSRAERKLQEKLDLIEEGIEQKLYPSWDNSSFASGVFSQLNLQSDIEAMVRQKDLLFSLYVQKLFVEGKRQEAVDLIRETETYLIDRMSLWLDDINGAAQAPQLRDEERRKLSPEDLESYIFQRLNRDRNQRYYSSVIAHSIDRLIDAWDTYSEFVDQLEDFSIEQEAFLTQQGT